jgi:predicted nucleic acid-binding protein
MRRLLVPDASVILKWVLKTDEADTEKALSLLSSWVAGEVEILLPSLWVYDVGNIIGRKNPQRSGEIMTLLLGYRFPEAKTDAPLVAAILEIMRTCNVTFYDAAYHAVAMGAGGSFVTADEVYFRKTGGVGQVILLGDVDI